MKSQYRILKNGIFGQNDDKYQGVEYNDENQHAKSKSADKMS